ncbi:putative mitochondrial protein, partial [Mucuna pruriens]
MEEIQKELDGAKKEVGGTCFRDLHEFNLAMLEKQGWKFIFDLMLWFQEFPKLYFSHGDFLDSEVGHNSSYIWRNIWTSWVWLREEHRWRIGDGRQVQVWKNPWLRDGGSMRVGSLPLPGTKRWNKLLIDELMQPHDIVAILRVPLLESVKEDNPIWFYNKQVFGRTIMRNYGMTKEEPNSKVLVKATTVLDRKVVVDKIHQPILDVSEFRPMNDSNILFSFCNEQIEKEKELELFTTTTFEFHSCIRMIATR